MSPGDPADRFADTEAFYAEFRPEYGDAVVEHLVDRFDLDADARVLDLGCGAGQLTVPLAARAGEVVGMDPNEAMLDHARERADAAGVDVEWVVGSDADLGDLTGSFRLTTIGRAFHWMDRERTLDRLQAMTEPGGGVALVGDEEWLTHGRDDWSGDVYDVVTDYVDDIPAREHPDDVEYDRPYDELLAEEGFVDVERFTTRTEREWTVEEMVGYVLSLSFCAPDLRDERAAFAADLHARLDGPCVQHVEEGVVSGRVP
ncbi:class I SAM-dependent methyltransferase [Halorarius halobius]|uniref:class I SAM-dependent methyltransferase n=1 Tax=Halorarius halobius TaxID=2962671 RepID=UPI0020CF232B|nr:class I SAM-dependent methyltransferase [Halorarius halobius]